MSVAMSLPPGEQAEILSPIGEENLNLKDQNQNEKENGSTEILNSASNDTTDQATSHKIDNCDPMSTNIPQISESTSQSPMNENESGFSMECSRATTFASEENLEIPNSKIQSDITMGSNDVEQNRKEISSLEPIAQPEEKNSTSKQLCPDFSDNCKVTEEKRSPLSSVENINTVQADVAQPLMMYDENSNSNHANYGAMKKPVGNIDEGTKESPLLSQSASVNISNKDETSEINPSMQSTFVNEPGNSLIEDVSPLFPSPSSWTDNVSASKEISDSPYMDSSDFSMEYSLVDKERIGDLETQPFTASASSKSGLCIVDTLDSILYSIVRL